MVPPPASGKATVRTPRGTSVLPSRVVAGLALGPATLDPEPIATALRRPSQHPTCGRTDTQRRQALHVLAGDSYVTRLGFRSRNPTCLLTGPEASLTC